MMEAGSEKVELPAHEPWSQQASLWGRLAGAVAYYYVLFDTDIGTMTDFDELQKFVNQSIAAVSERFKMRHTVVFNVFVGDLTGNINDIKKLIDTSEEFGFLPKYDVYFGVDTTSGQVMHNPKQPHSMDGALTKIKAAARPLPKGTTPKDAPLPSRFAVPVAKHPILCYIFMAINALLFVLMELDGGSTNVDTLIRYGAVSFHLVFTLGEYHRLLTPIFLHIGLMHLAVNTMSMILFGVRAERYFGHVKFLIIYVTSGVMGNLAMVFASEFALGAGASGAGYGLMGALFAFTKLRKKNVERFRASALGIMIVVGILMGFTMNQLPDMPNVGNAAHIGGLVTGLALGYFLTGKEKTY